MSGQTGHRHQAAHALRDLIEARPVGVRAVLAEAGDAGIDQFGIDLRQRLVIDAEPLLHIGPEILDQHIGFLDHALERRDAFGLFQIERHAAFVAVQVLKVAAFARAAHRLFDAGRGLDLDDIGAPVGKLAHAGRSRSDAGQIENGETRKSFRSAGKGHCGRLQRQFCRTGFCRLSFCRLTGRKGRTSPIRLPLSIGSDARFGQSFRRRYMDKMLGEKAIFPALSRGDHE